MDRQIRICTFTELFHLLQKRKDNFYARKRTKSETCHVVICGVMPQLFKRRPVSEKKLTKGSLRRIVYIVEEVLLQLILFSHWKCQEAALCGDSLVASMGVTQDDQVAP